MSKHTSSDQKEPSANKELSRRRFLVGAASQIAKHSLVTVPTATLVLNGVVLPKKAPRIYLPPLRRRNNGDNGNED